MPASPKSTKSRTSTNKSKDSPSSSSKSPRSPKSPKSPNTTKKSTKNVNLPSTPKLDSPSPSPSSPTPKSPKCRMSTTTSDSSSTSARKSTKASSNNTTPLLPSSPKSSSKTRIGTTNTKPISEFKHKYKIYKNSQVLGEGSYGSVRKCQNIVTKEQCAVKKIRKEVYLKNNNLELLQNEIKVLSQMNHPNIVKLYDIYEGKKYILLVTELCPGGELLEKVHQMYRKETKDDGSVYEIYEFPEYQVVPILYDLLKGVEYCHDTMNVTHRDLKLENLLLTNSKKDEDPKVKIIDFGFSYQQQLEKGNTRTSLENTIMEQAVGSPLYVAPEVLQQCYTYRCDLWSIGVIAYSLLIGYAPFQGMTDQETTDLILNGELEFPSPEWDSISDEAIGFVSQLLQKKDYLRPTAAMAIHHPWIQYHMYPMKPTLKLQPSQMLQKTRSQLHLTGTGTGSRSSSPTPPPPMTDLIRNTSDRRKAFHKLLHTMKVEKVIQNVTDDITIKEASEIGVILERVDKDKNGEVELNELDDAIHNTKEYSPSVRDNLQEMKDVLLRTKRISFDIRPFLLNLQHKCTLMSSTRTLIEEEEEHQELSLLY